MSQSQYTEDSRVKGKTLTDSVVAYHLRNLYAGQVISAKDGKDIRLLYNVVEAEHKRLGGSKPKAENPVRLVYNALYYKMRRQGLATQLQKGKTDFRVHQKKQDASFRLGERVRDILTEYEGTIVRIEAEYGGRPQYEVQQGLEDDPFPGSNIFNEGRLKLVDEYDEFDEDDFLDEDEDSSTLEIGLDEDFEEEY